MISTPEMPLAARRYLEELEFYLKQKVGVSPEQALSEVRGLLLSTSAELQRSGQWLSDEKLLDHFCRTFGNPDELAEKYGAAAARELPPSWKSSTRGNAPGWRICCTRCGRSAPLAAVGGIRINASSAHEYTIGWCSKCGWLRWLRIIKDLEEANLTERMGVAVTPEQSLRSMHKPVTTVLVAVLGTFAILAVVFGFLFVLGVFR